MTAYTPTNQKRDGRYRRIRLKLSDGDYKVAYRRGYYADNREDALIMWRDAKRPA